MMRFEATTSGTSAATIDESSTREEKVVEEEEEIDEVAHEELLCAIDTAARDSDSVLTRNTLMKLRRIAVAHGKNDEFYYVRLAILIAIKRRNHPKSQADGSGAGEKNVLQKILQVVAEEAQDLIVPLLPLIPVFGCWRDLRVFAVNRILDTNNSLLRGEEVSSSDLIVDPISSQICKIFAEQIQADLDLIRSDKDALPSSACKYVMHENRHDGKRKISPSSSSEATRGWHGRGWGRGGRGGRGRGRHAIASRRAWGVDSKESDSETRSPLVVPKSDTEAADTGYMKESKTPLRRKAKTPENLANSALSTEIQSLLCPTSALHGKHAAEASFRKIRSELNGRLAEKGGMLEPLLCAKQWNKIDFVKAPKGSLVKNKTALMKSSEGTRWMKAMLCNLKAVPDMQDLPLCVKTIFSEIPDLNERLQRGELNVESPEISLASCRGIISPLQIYKAIMFCCEEQSKILESAKKISAAGGLDTSIPQLPVLVAVDTGSCKGDIERCELILAAYLLMRAQGLSKFAIDGNIITFDDKNSVSIAPSTGKKRSKGDGSTDSSLCKELEWLLVVPRYLHAPRDADATLHRIYQSIEGLLACGDSSADCIVLCSDFELGDSKSEELGNIVSRLQDTESEFRAPSASKYLRTMRIHRLKYNPSSLCDVNFQPRERLIPIPENPEDVSVDIVFVVDFTGSMSGIMNSVKEHLVNIINELSSTTKCGAVRIGFVGYRDYGDAGRIVTVPFKNKVDVQQVVDAIRGEIANGGGDEPEDLLSAIVATNQFDWRSHIRVCTVITDASAHGYSIRGGDSHSSGRCPDQQPPYPDLPSAVRTLANELNVDMLFMRLSPHSKVTEEMLHEQYPLGGYGMVELGGNSSSFKNIVLAAISTAVLSTMAKPSVSGLNSADGVTLGAIVQSLTASTRETIARASSAAVQEALGAVEGLKGDDAAASPAKKNPRARSDFERLMAELELESLAPARVALGLPCSISGDALSLQSALILLKSGITADMLIERNYPPGIVDRVREAASVLVTRL